MAGFLNVHTTAIDNRLQTGQSSMERETVTPQGTLTEKGTGWLGSYLSSQVDYKVRDKDWCLTR